MKSWPTVLLGALLFADTSATPMLLARRLELRALFCATPTGWHRIADAACATRLTARRTDAVGTGSDVAPGGVWSIVRHGSPSVTLRAELLAKSSNARVQGNPSRYRIVSPLDVIPRVTDDATYFERWTGPVVYRPLAVVTRADARDPEGWTAARLTPLELESFTRAFRRRVSLPDCATLPRNAPSSARGDYTARDVQLRGAYRATSAALLVGLVINQTTHPCDDVRDLSRTVHWFVQDTPMGARVDATAPRYVGNEMQLVAIADFDGDGKSEWLFAVARYNEDGFLLCMDHGRRSLLTNWRYH